MIIGAKINRNLTEQQAVSQLVAAVSRFVRKAQWHSPYNVMRPYRMAPINELRRPLIELKAAQKRKTI